MRWVALVIVAFFAGCIGTGTETGNPTFTAKLAITSFTSDAGSVDLPATTEEDGAVQISEAWVSVKEVDLVRQEVCDRTVENEVEVSGVVVDVAAGPRKFELDLPEDAYCRVRVRLDKPEDERSSPIGDDTLRIRGTTSGGTPFELASRRNFDLRLESRGQPFTVIDEADDAILVAFDVVGWFGDLALDSGTATGGTIVIDDDHNKDLLDTFEDQLEASLAVYRDSDRDGSVDDDERHPLAGHP